MNFLNYSYFKISNSIKNGIHRWIDIIHDALNLLILEKKKNSYREIQMK